MVQNIRSVFVALTEEFGSEEISSALDYGLSLAQEAKSHLTVQAAAVRLHLTNAWLSGFAARLVQAENRRLHRLAEALAVSAKAHASDAGVIATTYSPQLTYPDLLESFTALARLHDLSVVDAEPELFSVDRGLIEALLIQSGRPLLIVPPGSDRFSSSRIIIGWDASGRASRAVHDALPFLRTAEAVQVLTVTGEKVLPQGVDGSDLAPHLARHGVKVQVNCRAALDGDVAQTLRDTAALFRADIIVMGAYVHSRLREVILGGVTRSLLESSPLPLFMSY